MFPQTPDEENSYPINRTRVLLTMMTALWGEVSPKLRAASVKWNEKTIHLFFFYDGEISEEDYESAEFVGTEVIASFPKHKLKVDTRRLDYPALLPENKGELVYKRREHPIDI
ncbi:MAG: hypothetical protein L0207_00630 [Chlamydiae bacterium]|nr:hypothetical protein [Chlamydiota bacterium]